MNNNVLLTTKDDLLREYFNLQVIDESKSTKEFLLYFARILNLGLKAGLIQEEECYFISNNITYAIEKAIIFDEEDEFVKKDKQIANYMYVITLYLQSKTNWEAWLEVKNATSHHNAKLFIENAKNWIISELTKQSIILDSIKANVQKLDLENIKSCYKVLKKTLRDFIHFDNVDYNFDLKLYHQTVIQPGFYVFLVNDFGDLPNFYEKIKKMVSYFKMEVSILLTMNTKQIIKSRKEDFHNTYLDEKRELDTLKKEYVNTKELDEKIAQIKEKYKVKRLSMVELLDNCFFIDFIKEYAIFGLNKKGIINYPINPEEHTKMLSSIRFEIAVNEFIEMHKENLTSDQIKYLKREI